MIDNDNQSLSVSTICFHDPYSRLEFRCRVQSILAQTENLNLNMDIDTTSLIDALMKRGYMMRQFRGFEKSINRRNEIMLSLWYYDSSLIKKWCQDIGQKYEQIVEQLPNVDIRDQPFIQQHLLPPVDLRNNLEAKILEMSFYKTNFSCLDQYLNIKTLAYFGADLAKVPRKYYGKYFLLRKFLFVNDFIPKLSPLDERIFQQLTPLHPAKICIIGLSLPNLILGLKLSQLNVNVTIYPTSKAILQKWQNGTIPDLLQQGIFSCNEFEVSQIKQLFSHYIQMCENKSKEDKLKMTQRNICILVYLINEVLSESPGNNGKSAWMEIQNKIGVINLGNTNIYDKQLGEYDRSHDRIHDRSHDRSHDRLNIQNIRLVYDQFLILNHIKNDSITVGELKKYVMKCEDTNLNFHQYTKLQANKLLQENTMDKQNKAYIKFEYHYFPNKSYRNMKLQLLLNNTNPRLQISKNIFRQAQYVKNNWQVLCCNRKEREYYGHMIYGDEQQIWNTIRNKNTFIPCVKGQNLHLIRSQLQVYSYIYFMFYFHQFVEFNNQANVYSYNSQHIGIIHYFRQTNHHSVIAKVQAKYHQKFNSMEIVQTILQNQVLKNKTYLSPTVTPEIHPQIISEISRYFYIKQQSVLLSLIKPNPSHKLYMSCPIISSQGPFNRISCQLWINSKIFTQIIKQLEINSNSEKSVNETIDKILINQNMKNIEIVNSHGKLNDNNQIRKDNDTNVTNANHDAFIINSNHQSYHVPNYVTDHHHNNQPIQCQLPKPTKAIVVTNHLSKDMLNQNFQNTSQGDLFGLESEVVLAIKQSYKLSLKSPSLQPLPQILFSMPIPLPFQQPLYLCNPGLPIYLFTNLYLFHYLSVRISKSLSNPFRKAYFYQTCILFKGIPVYCIVQRQMNNSTDQILLFHTSYKNLMREVFLLKNNQERSIISLDEEQEEMRLDEHPMLLSSVLINNIRKQLGVDRGINDQTCSQILAGKVSQILNLRKKAQKSEKVYKSLKCANFTCQIFDDNIGQLIYDQIEEETNFYTKLYGLKDYGFEQIFMGKLNPIFIKNQMKGGFQRDFHKMDVEDDDEDSQLALNYLQHINTEQKYPIQIGKYSQSTSTLTIHRKFISPSSAFHYEISHYSFPIGLSILSHMPSPMKNHLPILLTTLAFKTKNIYLIMTQLKYLLHQQLNLAIKMANLCKSSQDYQRKMGIYFKISRMANIQQVSEDITKQKLEIMGVLRNYEGGQSTCDGQKWEQIEEMINEGNIYLYADEAVFVNQYL